MSPSATMNSFPNFIRESEQSPRPIDHAFPPFNPQHQYRGVYERAGFDVNKGSSHKGGTFHYNGSSNSFDNRSVGSGKRSVSQPIDRKENRWVSSENNSRGTASSTESLSKRTHNQQQQQQQKQQQKQQKHHQQQSINPYNVGQRSASASTPHIHKSTSPSSESSNVSSMNSSFTRRNGTGDKTDSSATNTTFHNSYEQPLQTAMTSSETFFNDRNNYDNKLFDDKHKDREIQSHNQQNHEFARDAQRNDLVATDELSQGQEEASITQDSRSFTNSSNTARKNVKNLTLDLNGNSNNEAADAQLNPQHEEISMRDRAALSIDSKVNSDRTQSISHSSGSEHYFDVSSTTNDQMLEHDPNSIENSIPSIPQQQQQQQQIQQRKKPFDPRKVRKQPPSQSHMESTIPSFKSLQQQQQQQQQPITPSFQSTKNSQMEQHSDLTPPNQVDQTSQANQGRRGSSGHHSPTTREIQQQYQKKKQMGNQQLNFQLGTGGGPQPGQQQQQQGRSQYSNYSPFRPGYNNPRMQRPGSPGSQHQGSGPRLASYSPVSPIGPGNPMYTMYGHQGPQGPRGPMGPQGPQGPHGPNGPMQMPHMPQIQITAPSSNPSGQNFNQHNAQAHSRPQFGKQQQPRQLPQQYQQDFMSSNNTCPPRSQHRPLPSTFKQSIPPMYQHQHQQPHQQPYQQHNYNQQQSSHGNVNQQVMPPHQTFTTQGRKQPRYSEIREDKLTGALDNLRDDIVNHKLVETEFSTKETPPALSSASPSEIQTTGFHAHSDNLQNQDKKEQSGGGDDDDGLQSDERRLNQQNLELLNIESKQDNNRVSQISMVSSILSKTSSYGDDDEEKVEERLENQLRSIKGGAGSSFDQLKSHLSQSEPASPAQSHSEAGDLVAKKPQIPIPQFTVHDVDYENNNSSIYGNNNNVNEPYNNIPDTNNTINGTCKEEQVSRDAKSVHSRDSNADEMSIASIESIKPLTVVHSSTSPTRTKIEGEGEDVGSNVGIGAGDGAGAGAGDGKHADVQRSSHETIRSSVTRKDSVEFTNLIKELDTIESEMKLDSQGSSYLDEDAEDDHVTNVSNVDTLDNSVDKTVHVPLKSEQKHLPGTGPCRTCKGTVDHDAKASLKPVFSKTGELSGQWHRGCFKCFEPECTIHFNKSVQCYIYEDNPYCFHHYSEVNGTICNKCRKGIEGTCIQNDVKEMWHIDCLSCEWCHCQIGTSGAEDYYIFEGKVMCPADAQRIMEGRQYSNGNYGGDEMMSKFEKRRTRMFHA